MIKRFAGLAGRSRLEKTLLRQYIVKGNKEVASHIANICELEMYQKDQVIVTQGGSDDDMYLIIGGSVSVIVNGNNVCDLKTDTHFGEMALIDSSARRSATIVAAEECVVVKISEPDFTSLAEKTPDLWRTLAVELGNRLRKQNDQVVTKREQSRIFLGSSAESIKVVRVIQNQFSHDPVSVQPWSVDAFGASRFTLEDLETHVAACDFAVMVFGPDDKVKSRGRVNKAPRDNVIFELGLFMGRLTRRRTFIVKPKNIDLKIPTDLLGLNILEYPDGDQADLSNRIGPACDEIRQIVNKLGPL